MIIQAVTRCGYGPICIDETSRRGRNYITVVADLVEHDVINVTPGKDPATVERFSRDFMDHNGVPEYVVCVQLVVAGWGW